MKESDDIAKLFEYLGDGQGEGYQEIVAQDRGGAAQIRWPVLGGTSAPRQEKAQQTASHGIATARPKPEFFIKLDPQPPATKRPVETATATTHSMKAGPAGTIAAVADDFLAAKANNLQAIFRRLESPQAQRLTNGRTDEIRPSEQTNQTLSLFQRLLGA